MCGWRLAMMPEMCGPSCTARVHAVGAAAAVEGGCRKGRPALTIINATVHCAITRPTCAPGQQCPGTLNCGCCLVACVRPGQLQALQQHLRGDRWYWVPGLAGAAGVAGALLAGGGAGRAQAVLNLQYVRSGKGGEKRRDSPTPGRGGDMASPNRPRWYSRADWLLRERASPVRQHFLPLRLRRPAPRARLLVTYI